MKITKTPIGSAEFMQHEPMRNFIIRNVAVPYLTAQSLENQSKYHDLGAWAMVEYGSTILDACLPFANLRHSHIGYAETEKINDPIEALNELKQCFAGLVDVNSKGNFYIPVALVRSAIKREYERYAQGNAGSFGRFFARLNYLLQNETVPNETV